MANPTYQSGFYAPGRGTAKYPELWDGCVGAWNPGLGNTGLSLRDWSGNGNHGTLNNGPTYRVGAGNQALNFDGTNDYVEVSSARKLYRVFESGKWTITYFANTAVTANDYPISFGNSASGSIYTAMLFNTSSKVQVNSAGGGGANLVGAAVNSATPNKWERYTITADAAVPEFSIRVNSVVADSNALPPSYSVGQIDRFTIGALGRSTTGLYVAGFLTDFRVYNYAISQRLDRLLAQRPGIAYERAPRKSYFLPPTASSRQYRLFRPAILRGA
jgi:hypothetical protein